MQRNYITDLHFLTFGNLTIKTNNSDLGNNFNLSENKFLILIGSESHEFTFPLNLQTWTKMTIIRAKSSSISNLTV